MARHSSSRPPASELAIARPSDSEIAAGFHGRSGTRDRIIVSVRLIGLRTGVGEYWLPIRVNQIGNRRHGADAVVSVGGSADGPARAGEIEVAVSAAQKSSAVRRVAKIYAVKLRSNRLKSRPITSRILPLFAPRQFPVSRGIPAAICATECPPLLLLSRVSTARGAGQDKAVVSAMNRSGSATSSSIATDPRRTVHVWRGMLRFRAEIAIRRPDRLPGVAALQWTGTRSSDATCRPRLLTISSKDPRSGSPLLTDVAKSPPLGPAHDTRSFDVRREPIAAAIIRITQAASRSSAPMSTAARASRLRAPRIFSSVAA